MRLSAKAEHPYISQYIIGCNKSDYQINQTKAFQILKNKQIKLNSTK